PSAAVAHAGDHEEADGIKGFGLTSQGVHGSLVVINAGARSDSRIGPAVIHQQLSTASEERYQIRIDGVDGVVVDFVGERDIAIEVERAPIPTRIFEDDV